MDVNKDVYEDVSLKEVLSAIYASKLFILVAVMLSTVITVLVLLQMPNIYRSEVVLSPAENKDSGSLLGQLGGVAALAGINVGSQGSNNQVGLALQVLQSKKFLSHFIEEHDLKKVIFAADGWNESTNELSYDPDLYQESVGWTRESIGRIKSEPSLVEVSEVFFEKNLSVSHDEQSGVVIIAVSHFSPYIAQSIVTKLVAEINKQMRERALNDSQVKITYLSDELEKNPYASVQKALNTLIEQEIKNKMLATIRPDYVFSTLDPALVPEKKDSPKRALMLAISIVLTMLLVTFAVVIRYLLKR